MRASAGNRVLMLLENDLYPQDSRVRREARALIPAGYQVTVIGPAGPGQPGYELIDGVRIRRFAAPPDRHGLPGYSRADRQLLICKFVLMLLALVLAGFG